MAGCFAVDRLLFHVCMRLVLRATRLATRIAAVVLLVFGCGMLKRLVRRARLAPSIDGTDTHAPRSPPHGVPSHGV